MSNVGRNKSCSCGSGKKYKNCCLGKAMPDKFAIRKKNATEILADEPKRDSILAAFFATLEFYEKRNWGGGCHTLSAILYVLYSELGLSPTLCVGKAMFHPGFVDHPCYFDHSWIELNGEIYDAAGWKDPFGTVLSPTIKGYDLDTKKPTKAIFGVETELEIRPIAQQVINLPFNKYMSGFPGYKNGIWGIVVDLGVELSLNLDLERLMKKYSETKWVVR